MVKPGWQKSEFWLTAFAVIVTALKAFGVEVPGAPTLPAQTAALVVATATGLYTVARSIIYTVAALKLGQTPATPAPTPAPAPVVVVPGVTVPVADTSSAT